MLKRLFLCLFFLVTGLWGFAQTPTTQGADFWVSFLKNGYKTTNTTGKLTLVASGPKGTEVRWENTFTGVADNASILDRGYIVFDIPYEDGYNDQNAGTAFRGVHVYTTNGEAISLYAANEASNSFDVANVLPVDALGTNYMILTNKSIGEASSNYTGLNRASFLVVATEPNTRVQITPSCLTADDHEAHVPYVVTLEREGTCYHVLNKNAGGDTNTDGDFTGTLVESLDGQPIAVFNGNCLTRVMETPIGTTGYEHVFEQAMPVDYWGQHFVVTSSHPGPTQFHLQSDLVKVTALEDGTTIKVDGTEQARLNAGESTTFWMDLTSRPCAYVTADRPAAVCLYNHSHQSSSGSGSKMYGDPSMVWISPVEQTIEQVMFSTFQADKVERHFVNVVCRSDAQGLYLDGVNIASALTPVTAAPEYAYVRVDTLSHGAHTLSCVGGLTAHVYGVGEQKGYAYTVGSSARVLSKQLYVNDELSTDYPNGYTVCQNDALIDFRVFYNADYDHIAWEFGDGTTAVGEAVPHQYSDVGNYEVMARVFRETEGEMQPADSLSVTIHVQSLINKDINEESCASFFTFYGRDYPIPFQGDTIVSSDEGCDTLFHLNLQPRYLEPHYTYVEDACGPIMWFDTLRDVPGWYTVRVPLDDGCDSTYRLHLAFVELPTNCVRQKESCEAYDWNGVLCETTGPYTQTFHTEVGGCPYDSTLYFTLIPPGDTVLPPVEACGQYEWMGKTYTELGYHRHDTIIEGPNGCRTHFFLDLTLYETPSFDAIVGLDQVAVATSFWPGQYRYYLDDSTTINYDRIRWELLDNPEGPDQWEFRPHGASCTIVAYAMGDRTLRVTTGDGLCDKTVVKPIHCSGYAVDTYGTLGVEVYPNPAKDVVTVKGEGLKEVSVYNLLGQKLKSVLLNGDAEMHLQVDDLPQALYLFKIHTSKGNMTRLVSVNK